MVSWRSQHLPFYLGAKPCPAIPVQRVNELSDEPRRMVHGNQFVKGRRQHPHLLSAHLSKRHISISPTGVASKVHLTTHPLPDQTSETGSYWKFNRCTGSFLTRPGTRCVGECGGACRITSTPQAKAAAWRINCHGLKPVAIKQSRVGWGEENQCSLSHQGRGPG